MDQFLRSSKRRSTCLLLNLILSKVWIWTEFQAQGRPERKAFFVINNCREPLVERNWIEQHLEYTRRYNLTDDAVASAADFRRQNKEECLASLEKETENYLLLESGDESFESELSEDHEAVSRKAEAIFRPTSPNPYDLKDDRIKDYTVNHVNETDQAFVIFLHP